MLGVVANHLTTILESQGCVITYPLVDGDFSNENIVNNTFLLVAVRVAQDQFLEAALDLLERLSETLGEGHPAWDSPAAELARRMIRRQGSIETSIIIHLQDCLKRPDTEGVQMRTLTACSIWPLS